MTEETKDLICMLLCVPLCYAATVLAFCV